MTCHRPLNICHLAVRVTCLSTVGLYSGIQHLKKDHTFSHFSFVDRGKGAMSVALLLVLNSLLTAGRCEHIMNNLQLTEAVGTLKETVESHTLVITRLTNQVEELNRTECGCSHSGVRPGNCADATLVAKSSGVRTLNISGLDVPVYCDQTTSGGGWTVIQKRIKGSVDFYRNWQEYENGFGDVSGDYWLGLKNIYTMTSSGHYSLRVDLEDFSGKTAYAEYSDFHISGPEDNYRLDVSGYVNGTAGQETGYGLTYNNNASFTTRDRENDGRIDGFNCALLYQGGWWYTEGCGYTNLNGVYKPAGHNYVGAIFWYGLAGTQALKRAEMKIRPA